MDIYELRILQNASVIFIKDLLVDPLASTLYIPSVYSVVYRLGFYIRASILLLVSILIFNICFSINIAEEIYLGQ